MALVPAQATRTIGGTISAANDTTDFTNLRDTINTSVVHTDVAKTISVTHTFSAAQTFSAGVAITGNSTIAGTLGSLTGLTLASGNATLTSGNLVFGAASAKIIPGATSLLFRDTGDANTNLSLTDAGAATIRAGLTVTAGGLTVSAGTTAVQALTCTTLAPSGLLTTSALIPFAFAATAKIVCGATSWAIKDSGDGVEGFKLAGTGTSTTITVNSGSSGGVTLTGNSSNTVILSASNTRLNANNGLILFGTDGTNPISGTSTLGFPVMPYTSGAPTGILSSSKIGSFELDDSNKRLYIWTSLGWYYTALIP